MIDVDIFCYGSKYCSTIWLHASGSFLIRAPKLGRRPIGIRFVCPSVCLSVNILVSDTITWVIFNVQLSYFIHRCRMWEEDTYTFWGPKVKVTTELCQQFGSDMITLLVFNVQLSYFIHRWRMVKGRYLYILGSKGQRSWSQLNFIKCWSRLGT